MHFGHKIILSFVAFGGIMFYLVYRSMTTEFELVSKEYYKEELAYQDVIDATQNSNALNGKVTVKQEEERIMVNLPEEMKGQVISGELYFYCAADSKKDRKFPIQTDGGLQQVVLAGKQVPSGAYTVRISWTAQDKPYYYEQYLMVP
ncbi:FixH family protein [Flavihumibacter rivuli]|uniref:FixH family protein n=1 Tax=Flavihumibacter rivuli TaxID=2838156 RepID=UPI001BDE37BD|nr:FixH family protein [Flavihumibacter rivuli]ULQ58410.1 FixH family protein [Flavihumibacter rivuli]